ncbi:hypothetical protein J31TS4_36740 [Paenibacillus sp. J31TS4]|nr:hypothetical protein J31TS4_36740 [Paenibacillus sp. J31TS4]
MGGQTKAAFMKLETAPGGRIEGKLGPGGWQEPESVSGHLCTASFYIQFPDHILRQ